MSENVGLKLNIQKTKIMASGPITSWQIDGQTMETVTDFIFLGSKITADGDCSHEIKRCLLLGRKVMNKLRWHIKKQRHYFANKGPSSQGYGFSSSHVWMWELNCKESCTLKNWCFWTVLEKTLESPLHCKEIPPVYPKGNQSWIFIGRTNVEPETPIVWPLDAKNWLIWKDPDAGKDWRREEKGTTEDEMVGWHHWLTGWVWVSSESWWRTGRPGVLQSMGPQRVGHDWAELKHISRILQAQNWKSTDPRFKHQTSLLLPGTQFSCNQVTSGSSFFFAFVTGWKTCPLLRF